MSPTRSCSTVLLQKLAPDTLADFVHAELDKVVATTVLVSGQKTSSSGRTDWTAPSSNNYIVNSAANSYPDVVTLASVQTSRIDPV